MLKGGRTTSAKGGTVGKTQGRCWAWLWARILVASNEGLMSMDMGKHAYGRYTLACGGAMVAWAYKAGLTQNINSYAQV